MVKNLKKKYSSFFSSRRDIPEPENSVEGIYPSLEKFKSSLEETDPVLRNMDTYGTYRVMPLRVEYTGNRK